jgi:hypothetical protein
MIHSADFTTGAGWLAALTLGFVLFTPAVADEVSPQQVERWFQSDELEAPTVDQVNTGDLEFLQQAPQKPVHHHHNSVTLFASSLQDGWVALEQCHTDLDKVPAAQILFKASRVKALKIREARNIERAWVEGPSVQMENIGANARLCLSARTRALRRLDDGSYLLRNGPFMRRFLDGYFPLRVSMDIYYAGSGLRLVGFSPEQQPGFEVNRKPGELHFDALFEGRLVTEFHFRPE